MAKMTNLLVANITSTEDSTSAVVVNRSTGNPAFDSSVSQMTEYFILAGGANVIPLPISPACQIYIKNNDAAKSIQVTWTQNGGGSVSIIQLNPGDQISFWTSPTGAPAPIGITALSLTPSVAGALVEFFIGG